jgi:hypothetical protein
MILRKDRSQRHLLWRSQWHVEPIHDLNRPHCGVVSSTRLSPYPGQILDLVWVAKGRLYLLCEQAVDPLGCESPATLLCRFFLSYLPSLSRRLAAVYAHAADARHQIRAVVAPGVEGLLWGRPRVRYGYCANEARMCCRENEFECTAFGSRSTAQPLLHSAQIRLFTGDALVMVGSRAGLTPGGLAKVVRSGTSAEGIARAVAHQARKSLHRSVPVTAIRLPGFMPIPDL